MTTGAVLFLLWWPIALAIASLTALVSGSGLFLGHIYDALRVVLPSLPEFDVSRTKFPRVASGVVFSAIMMFIGIRDYSFLFPSRLNVDIYFDDEGLEKTLKIFSGTIKVMSDYRAERDAYIVEINHQLTQISNNFELNTLRGRISGSGSLTFLISKQYDGVQKYKIEKANGRISYRDSMHRGMSPMDMEFNLAATDSNEIDVDFDAFAFKHVVFIMPEFTHYVYYSPTDIRMMANVVAATAVRFFPYPEISRTLYLVRRQGNLIPIGYGIYFLEKE